MLKNISAALVLFALASSSIPSIALAEEDLAGLSIATQELIQEQEDEIEEVLEFEVLSSSTPKENITGTSTEEELSTSTAPTEIGSSTPDETATTTETYLNIEARIVLPNGCDALDSEGENHIFPQENSSSEYLAICALMKALEEGEIDELGLSNNPSFGLFVESINGIQEEEHFWALWHNGEFAGCGIGCLELQGNDVIAFVLTSFGGEETHRVTIHTDSLLETFNNVSVPDICSITAASSTDPTATSTHFFPHDSSPSDFLGVCALVQAKEKGFVNEFEFIDFGWGLWLDSINEIKTAEDWSAFWALSINGEEAPVGIADLAVEPGDIIMLSYEDEHVAEFRVTALIESATETPKDPEEETGTSTPPDSGSGGSGAENAQHTKLDVQKALEYLDSKQKSDGSFGADLYTDWVALAVVAGKIQDPGIGNSLKNYLLNSNPSLSSITDYERRAMALMAMGISPYDGTEINYIEKIVESFDGDQIGDPGLVNDDIFALFPLLKAGYSQNDEIIKESVSFILSRQSSSGRWESPDLTGAAIQALSMVRGLPGARNAIDEAVVYLRSIQEDNGGFGTNFGSSGTSWIMQALISAGEHIEGWEKGGKNPHDYLYSVQEEDGGVEDVSRNTNDRIWATAYAIPAALEISWEDILKSFSLPKISQTRSTTEESEEENEEAPAEEEEVVEEVLGVSTSTPETEENTDLEKESVVFDATSVYNHASASDRIAQETTGVEGPERESEKDDQVEILEEKEKSVEPQEQEGAQTATKVLIIMGTLLALGIAFKLFKP